MAKAYNIHIWKKAPFLRLLLPVIFGIIIEYYCRVEINIIIFAALIFTAAYIIFSLLPLVYRFKFQAMRGIIISIFMIIAGLFLTWHKDIRNHADWYGNRYDSSSYLIATIS